MSQKSQEPKVAGGTETTKTPAGAATKTVEHRAEIAAALRNRNGPMDVATWRRLLSRVPHTPLSAAKRVRGEGGREAGLPGVGRPETAR